MYFFLDGTSFVTGVALALLAVAVTNWLPRRHYAYHVVFSARNARGAVVVYRSHALITAEDLEQLRNWIRETTPDLEGKIVIENIIPLRITKQEIKTVKEARRNAN